MLTLKLMYTDETVAVFFSCTFISHKIHCDEIHCMSDGQHIFTRFINALYSIYMCIITVIVNAV